MPLSTRASRPSPPPHQQAPIRQRRQRQQDTLENSADIEQSSSALKSDSPEPGVEEAWIRWARTPDAALGVPNQARAKYHHKFRAAHRSS
jgi:hypothetical protein